MPKPDWNPDQPFARLGPALRALRERRDLSLEGLAAATGLTAAWIDRVERKVTRPSLTQLETLLAALDADLGDLFVEQLHLEPTPAPTPAELRSQLEKLQAQVDRLQAALEGVDPVERLATLKSDETIGRRAVEITRRLQSQHDSLSIEPATAALWDQPANAAERPSAQVARRRGKASKQG